MADIYTPDDIFNGAAIQTPTDPKVALATNEALKNGADPANLAAAKQQLGEKAYIGYCQAFVADTAGGQNHGASAIEAWNNQQDKATQGLNGISPGDEIYFNADDSNGGNGHTGIYSGNNHFISATNNGIEEQDLADWQKSTGQQLLGYISPNKSTEILTPDDIFNGQGGTK